MQKNVMDSYQCRTVEPVNRCVYDKYSNDSVRIWVELWVRASKFSFGHYQAGEAVSEEVGHG